MDTDDRLLDTATSLFARQGVDAVGIQEVCDRSGVTKPTLYHHFGSKEGLVRTLVDRGYRRLDAALDELGPYDRDLPWYLERMGRLWVGVVDAQPDWFRVQLSLAFLPPDNPMAALVKPGSRALTTRFEALFAEAALQYGNMRGRQVVLAAGWLATLRGWTALYLADEIKAEEGLIHAGTRQFLYGVFS